MKGNFVWDLPDIRQRQTGAASAIGLLVNDWQFSGIWPARTGSPYAVAFSYQNGGGNTNLTGSNDYAARVQVVGDPGSGCSGNVYRQFNTAAFQGPAIGSVGLESGNGYVRSCFLEHARSVDRAQHPSGRRAADPAARRHVQRAERRDDHRPE